MEARSLDAALKLIMEQRGCSGNQLARDLGVSQSWLSYASRGKKDTSTGKAIRLLARVGWEVVIRPKREEEDSVKRREFVTAAASVMFVPSPKLGPYEDPAFLRYAGVSIARTRRENGGIEVLSIASRHYQHIQSIIKGDDQQLQGAASHLARQIAWTLHDAGRLDAADNVGRLAHDLALRAGDVESQALAYHLLANNATMAGAGDRGIKHANRGLQLRGASSMAQMWLRNDSERSLALLHGPQQIGAMRKFLEQDLNFDAISSYGMGITSQKYSAADMAHAAGRNLFLVSAYEEAYEHFGHAVALSNEWPARQADFSGWQIRTGLRVSDPDPYLLADRIITLARVAPLVSSGLVDQSVADIYTESRRWAKIPAIRNAREHLYDVMPKQVKGSLPR